MRKTKTPLPRLPGNVAVIDSHCHLDMNDYKNDLDEVVNNAFKNGVKGIVTIGTDLPSSQSAIKIAGRYSGIRATVGIHPHDADSATDDTLTEISNLVAENLEEVVGYGEIGLDYVKNYSDPRIQRNVFRTQLRLARELKLPVIIHDREAHNDCLKIIKEEGPFEQGGIMHCFSGDLTYAHRLIDCNFHISIPGVVTFNKAEQMQRVATHVPAEWLLVETDGPFLAPVPYRGKRNEPLYVLYTVTKIAELRETIPDEIAQITTTNGCKLFNYRFNC